VNGKSTDATERLREYFSKNTTGREHLEEAIAHTFATAYAHGRDVKKLMESCANSRIFTNLRDFRLQIQDSYDQDHRSLFFVTILLLLNYAFCKLGFTQVIPSLALLI